MKNQNYKVIFYLRYIIILFIVIDSISTFDISEYKYFVFLLLVFVLNIQMRANFFKNEQLIISILFDMLLIYSINMHFGGISYILIFITLIDSLLTFETELYVFSLIIALFLAFLLKSAPFEIISLNILFYSLSIAYIFLIKKLDDSLKKTKTLYDSNRLQIYEIENAKNELEEYARTVEYLAQVEERIRISREIHDAVGHKLTSTLMQFEASHRVLSRDYEKGKEMLYSVKDNLNNCINLLRQTVKNIAPSDYNSRIVLIREMLDDFSKATGVDIKFNIIGLITGAFPGVELLLYRNIQESVTNSVRHGKASYISIELVYLPDQIILSIEDNGICSKNITKGMGIRGMEERARILGGKLIISTEDKFTVKTIIPIQKIN